jgi:PAS domain S-box-containing protein
MQGKVTLKTKYRSPRNSTVCSLNSPLKQDEEALQAEHNKLLSIMEAMEYAITMEDEEYNIIYQNEQARISSGGDHVGEKCYRAYAGRERVCDECPVEEAFRDGRSHISEKVRALPSGELSFWEITANPVRNAEGRVVSSLEIGKNITERKRSQERHRIILQTALDGFYVLAWDGRLLEVNASYCKMVGYTREELLKMSIFDIEAMETPEEIARHAEKVAEQGYDFFETQHQCKDGKKIHVEVSANYIDVEGGQTVVFVRNITQRRWAAQALMESERRYRTLVENIPQKIFFKDKNSVYISCNSNYAEDLQLKPVQISGHTDYDFYPRQLAEKYRADDKRVMESGKTERIEERYIERGRERTVETFKTPFIDENGKTVGVLGVFHDVTEQKKLERQSHDHEIAKARAEELNMSRRRLMNAQESLRRDIAGELHGTVQSRLILVEHKIAELEARARSERMTKELADIRQRVGELRNEQIRSISRRLFPAILRMGLATGLESLVDEYSANLSIDLRVSKKLRDREQANRKLIPDNVKLALYRITEEALTNISKHAQAANNITVKLSLSDSRILRLTVRDDGSGFDTASPPSGVGLRLISDYAAAAGGNCTVKSIPGQGTWVTAEVPLARLETGERQECQPLE